MGLPQRKSDDTTHYTYADYLTWPENVRYQLINGLALMMAGPGRMHQMVTGDVFRQAANALQGKPCQAYVAPLDVRLPKANEPDEQIDTVVQPDVLVICDESKLDWRGVRGAPDWVVEVLSPPTAGQDRVQKRRLYEQAGVLEYWLIQPADRILTIYRLINGEYGKPDIQELSGDTPVGVLEGVTIQWDELAARLPQPEY